MTVPFRVEALGPGHSRDGFACGVQALDHYLASQAGQDARRRVSACYVAVEGSSGRIAGYYTLAAAGVPLTDLPDALTKRLPRYPSVPVARVGRLAVDQAFQGHKLGGALLADAALRATRSEVAVFALVVDAKDEAAAAFYRHFGFQSFGASARQLIVSLKNFAPDAA
ncbi:MAG: GNAT family N-acetyltransferase [Burkholderiales bacterium]|nr:GNAT family N-acetyltransferase [Burkholderiales bacterium]MDE2396451.1 GNAT family N-acetyltransferase [Burkholderiales bacterium]